MVTPESKKTAAGDVVLKPEPRDVDGVHVHSRSNVQTQQEIYRTHVHI